MSIRLQILLVIACLIALLYIVSMVKKKRLDFKYALGWALGDIVIAVLAVFPKSLIWISQLFGIASPVNMLFFFGFCISVLIIFFQSVSISHLSDKVKKMAQEIAIMRKDSFDRDQEKREE